MQRLRRLHYGWIVTAVTFATLLASSGVRFSFGVFLKPLQQEFGWDRAAVSLAASLALVVYGVGQVLVGSLVDRQGPRRVLLVSTIVIGLGAVATAFIRSLWQLYLVYGVVTALAAGGTALVTGAAVAAHWFEKSTGLVVGLLSSGVSAGQLVLIPLAMGLTVAYGWRVGYAALGLLLLVVAVPPLLVWMRDDPSEMGMKPYGAGEEGLPSGRGQNPTRAVAERAGQAAAEQADARPTVGPALRTRRFWMLAGSFFACGYTSAGVIQTHLVAYATDHGLRGVAAAGALGLMGAMNVLGAVLSGYLSDRLGNRALLAAVYLARGLSLLFLMTVRDAAALNLFAVVFGLSYLATVPPTSALTVELFHPRSVATLYGIVSLSHQVGAGLGSYLGGWAYDRTGDYQIAFLSAALLAFAAAAMALGVRARPQPAEAAAPAD